MRIRCSKGLRISAFHGHFFIRSSDLLALPQVPHHSNSSPVSSKVLLICASEAVEKSELQRPKPCEISIVDAAQ